MSAEQYTDAQVRRFRREMERSLSQLDSVIREALARATVDEDGNLVADVRSMAIAGELGKQIASTLDGTGSKVAEQFRATLAELIRRVGSALDRAGIGPQFTTVSMQSLTMQAGVKLDKLVNQATRDLKRAGSAVETQLRRVVVQAMRTNADPAQAQEALAGVIGTSVARSIATTDTTLAGTDRALTVDFAAEAGVEWFAYLGPDDQLTRDDCRSWVGHRFTRDQMDALKSKSGPQPPSVYGGGYYCRHRWEPLVEPEDVQRYPPWHG